MTESPARRRGGLSAFVDTRLARMADDFSDDWPTYLAATAAVGIVVVAGMQLLVAASVGLGGPVPAWLGVGVSVVLAAACLVVLGWAYWRISLDPRDAGPHLVILLSSVVTIGASMLAFAGVTMVALRGGLLTPAPGSEPDLWATEQYYAWNVIHAVPFLDVPGTLAWSEPRIFAGGASGGMLLLFTLVFITPLLRIAVAGYRLADRAWFAARERRRYRPRRLAELSFMPSWWDAWGSLGMVLFSIAVAFASLALLMNPSSPLRHTVTDLLNAGMNLAALHVPVAWLLLPGEWLLVACLVWLVSEALDEVSLAELLDLDSLRGLLGALLTYLCLPVLAMLVIAAATIALLHTGIAAAQRPIPAQHEVAATLLWYTWHVADSIPGLDLPRTVGWSPDYELVDRWSGGLLLVCKLVLAVVLVVPVGRLIGIHVEGLRRRVPAPAALDAAQSFGSLLHDLEVALNEIERLRRRQPERTRDIMVDDLDDRAESSVLALEYRARRAVEAMERKVAEVRTLFGSGRVSDAAIAALVAAHARLDAVSSVATFSEWPWREKLGELERARGEAVLRAEEYREEAAAALLRAAGPRAAAGARGVRSARRRRPGRS